MSRLGRLAYFQWGPPGRNVTVIRVITSNGRNVNVIARNGASRVVHASVWLYRQRRPRQNVPAELTPAAVPSARKRSITFGSQLPPAEYGVTDPNHSPAKTYDSYTWPSSVAPSTNVTMSRRCHSPTTQAGSGSLRLRRRCPCRTVSCAATWPTSWWPSLALIELS